METKTVINQASEKVSVVIHPWHGDAGYKHRLANGQGGCPGGFPLGGGWCGHLLDRTEIK